MTGANACVIGWPVSHSRSPLIHGHWLRTLGIAGSYERVAVEPGRVPAFLARIQAGEFIGCNVTLPHKEAAFQSVAIADDATRRLGVVNTVFKRHGELLGTSTDGEGFMASLAAALPAFQTKGERVAVIGAGGAARAIVGTLAAHGAAEIRVFNRTAAAAERLRSDFGPSVKPMPLASLEAGLDGADLLVNTSSLGMKGQPPLEISLGRLPARALVSDIVYVPLETPLIAAARRRGNPVAPGLGMLLHQAVRGFELWFGQRPVVTEALYDLVARDVDPDYQRQ